MKYVYKNVGVCSKETILELDENHIIKSIEIIGGCDGNLKGITALLKGEKAEDVIRKLEGIQCGYKKTSCPDQVAAALKEALKDKM